MQLARTVADLRRATTGWRASAERIGLVPTMGALHAGHMTLVDAARAACDRVVVSIFVNPKQFGPADDLTAYPRPESADLEMLRAAGADLAFLPGADEVYPPGFATLIHVGGLGEGLCGAHRPGHFDGVATVVAKLLIEVQPDIAYFGEKDYQQLLLVRRLARDLDLPVEIAGVPTVREADGLAMSSRNAYLSPGERRLAPSLARVLQSIAAALAAEPGAVSRELARGRAELEAAGLAVEYLEIRDSEALTPVTIEIAADSRVFAAVRLGRTRLIDNLPICRAEGEDKSCPRG
ncbi:MAG TPA: pantoate--beta-alanine ligase [Stellaceae bacterium]|nr:pantoate--beta-alanine ligase [Stellaceae bacterium]